MREPMLASTLLGAALALWRGPVLPHLAHHPLAEAEIKRLEQLRLTALETRIESDLELDRHIDVLPELEILTTEIPTHQPFRRLLMITRSRCGRLADGSEAGGPLPPSDGAASLSIRAGNDEERVVPLDPKRSYALGRNLNADIPLPWDASVSRVHAVVEHAGGTWTVSDDRLSTNGTFCNDDQVRGQRRLENGDVLRLGATTIVFRDTPGSAQRTTVITSAATQAA